MNKKLKSIFERPSSSESMSVFGTTQCKDPLSFSLWIVTHLASLYQFDRNGNLEEKVGMLFPKYLKVVVFYLDLQLCLLFLLIEYILCYNKGIFSFV